MGRNRREAFDDVTNFSARGVAINDWHFSALIHGIKGTDWSRKNLPTRLDAGDTVGLPPDGVSEGRIFTRVLENNTTLLAWVSLPYLGTYMYRHFPYSWYECGSWHWWSHFWYCVNCLWSSSLSVSVWPFLINHLCKLTWVFFFSIHPHPHPSIFLLNSEH